MPTDENNWVIPQNQQVNSNQQFNPNQPLNPNQQVNPNLSWNQIQNSEDSADDFDFNFIDQESGTVNSVDPQVLQDQVENDWRIWMFKTSDEELNLQQQNDSIANQVWSTWDMKTDVSMGSNVDVNENVNSDSNSSNENAFSNGVEVENVQNDDNFSNMQGDLFDKNENNENNVQIENNTQKDLWDEIQSMISFDDDANVDWVADPVKSDGDVINIQDNLVSTSEWNSNTDDWLAAEDKEVEESFWGQDRTSMSEEAPDVNVPAENVVQNVEDIIGNQDNDLQKNTNQYIPDENEYSKLSNLLDSSNVWQVDLSNIDNKSPNEDIMSNWNVDGSAWESGMTQWNADVSAENNIQWTYTNDWTPNSFNIDAVNLSEEEQPVGFWLWALNNNSAESQNYEWDSLINLDSMIDNDIEKLSNVNDPQWTNGMNSSDNMIWNLNQDTVQDWQQINQQDIKTNKWKKQSWFKVIWIFLWVVLLLAILWVVASKMFPDKFNLGSMFWWSKVIEYVDNDWIKGVLMDSDNWEENELDGDNTWEENSLDENSLEWLDWGEDTEVDNNTENDLWEWDDWDNDNELDPNSLAGLLENEDSENDTTSTWDDIAWILTGDNNDSDSEEEFDPFAGFDEIIDEDRKTVDMLENYISDWEFYKNLWDKNGNNLLSKYGEFVMIKAQDALTKLENWEEINTNLFSELDSVLERSQSLVD